MITISIINRKGGVGKTVTTVNLAYCLSAIGYKVLLVDADSQRDLSKMFRVPPTVRNTICNVFLNSDVIKKTIRKTSYDNLHILPGEERLEILHEIEEDSLLEALRKVEDDFDVCLIDCPPSMQISTVNALIASDYIISPMRLDAFSAGGVLAIDRLVGQCKEYNSNIEMLGALITMYRSNKNANSMVIDLIKQSPFPLMDTVIRYDTAVDRSTVRRKPLAKCASRGKAAADYVSLAEEVRRKVGL